MNFSDFHQFFMNFSDFHQFSWISRKIDHTDTDSHTRALTHGYTDRHTRALTHGHWHTDTRTCRHSDMQTRKFRHSDMQTRKFRQSDTNNRQSDTKTAKLSTVRHQNTKTVNSQTPKTSPRTQDQVTIRSVKNVLLVGVSVGVSVVLQWLFVSLWSPFLSVFTSFLKPRPFWPSFEQFCQTPQTRCQQCFV